MVGNVSLREHIVFISGEGGEEGHSIYFGGRG